MAEIDPDEKEKMLGELETRGKLRGFREGRIQGSLKMLLALVADGLLPIEAAVERAEKWLAAYDNSNGPEIEEGERMGVGNVLDMLEGRGFAEGCEEGRVMGGKSMLVELVVDGLPRQVRRRRRREWTKTGSGPLWQ